MIVKTSDPSVRGIAKPYTATVKSITGIEEERHLLPWIKHCLDCNRFKPAQRQG